MLLLRISGGLRRFSTAAPPLIKIDSNYESAIATLTMNNLPVNSLSLEMIDAVREGITIIENDKKIKGLILASSSPTVFSAGLDIREMHKPDQIRLKKFWTSLQELWMKLYGTSLATGAAINGHAPAGGCLLAMTCDYRVMAEGNYSIGLNETQLGIAAPSWFIDTFRNTVGHRQAERMLALGLMVKSTEAHKIGLVDEVVPQDKVMEHTIKEISSWIKLPRVARHKSKLGLRQIYIDHLKTNQAQDTKAFCDFANTDEVQQNLDNYLNMLAKRSKKKE